MTGNNSRQRQKTEAKKSRHRDHRRAGAAAAGAGGAAFHDVQAEERLAAELIERDQWARATRDRGRQRQIGELLELMVPEVVASEVEARLAEAVEAAWALGWLPGEVLRQCRRSISEQGERLVAGAVAADRVGRSDASLHPRWHRHLDALALPEVARWGWLTGPPPVGSSGAAAPEPELVGLGCEVLFELRGLRRLGPVIPPPGSAEAVDRSMVDLAGQETSPQMTRVRRLLAKAESTTFEAEAEAYIAKAQKLMARHAIDAAMLWAETPSASASKPTAVRLPVDDPYARAKASLVTVVAEAARCRAVIDVEYGLVTVIGFEADLLWCETLYTSLLVQAQRELHRAGTGEPAGGRRRSRGFRSSFLTAFAARVGQRLREVTTGVEREWTDDHTRDRRPGVDDRKVAGGDAGRSLVPVLADRHRAVDDAVEASFGKLRSLSFGGGTDPVGWHEGRAAADRADLSRRQLRSERRAGAPGGELGSAR